MILNYVDNFLSIDQILKKPEFLTHKKAKNQTFLMVLYAYRSKNEIVSDDSMLKT